MELKKDFSRRVEEVKDKKHKQIIIECYCVQRFAVQALEYSAKIC